MSNCIPQSYRELANRKDNSEDDNLSVSIVSTAELPTKFGNFIAIAFDHDEDDREHAAFIKGDLVGKENVLVRIHSECLTGDAIGSLRCDCRDQLQGSLRAIEEEGEGVVIYLRQEGRGIGLTNKLRAYQLQDEGLNTVEANHALGFEDDERDYKLAAHMLRALGIKSVRIMTNNPNKIMELENHGIRIQERIEHVFETNEHNEFYLLTKKFESGHLINEKLEEDNYFSSD